MKVDIIGNYSRYPAIFQALESLEINDIGQYHDPSLYLIAREYEEINPDIVIADEEAKGDEEFLAFLQESDLEAIVITNKPENLNGKIHAIGTKDLQQRLTDFFKIYGAIQRTRKNVEAVIDGDHKGNYDNPVAMLRGYLNELENIKGVYQRGLPDMDDATMQKAVYFSELAYDLVTNSTKKIPKNTLARYDRLLSELRIHLR